MGIEHHRSHRAYREIPGYQPGFLYRTSRAGCHTDDVGFEPLFDVIIFVTRADTVVFGRYINTLVPEVMCTEKRNNIL